MSGKGYESISLSPRGKHNAFNGWITKESPFDATNAMVMDIWQRIVGSLFTRKRTPIRRGWMAPARGYVRVFIKRAN